MTTFLILLWLAACGFVFWSLFSMIWRQQERRKLKLHAAGGFLFGCLLIYGVSKAADYEAQTAGFASASDQREADRAGVKDPIVWKSMRIAAIEEERSAKTEAIEAARRIESERISREEREAAEATLQAQRDANAAESEAKAQAAKVEEERQGKDLACRRDIQCWGEEGFPAATAYCQEFIEGLAKWDFQWTDGWTEPKFSHYRWKDQKKGIVSYIGDKLKLQNGFGAWKHVRYTCDFDPASKKVMDVSAG